METQQYLADIRRTYRNRLVDNILPFWLDHGMDTIYGGIHTGLDRYGSLLESDKSVWFQGRALWTFSTAYADAKPDPLYLEAAQSLVRFIEEHCFDGDGRMFFRVSQEGKPVIKRQRYFFSETFAIIGWAAYSRATGDTGYAMRAFSLLKTVLSYRRQGSPLTPKFNQNTEATRGFGEPMILLNTAQELRKALPEEKPYLEALIDSLIDEIRTYFVREERELVVEQCGADGSLLDHHFEGRLLNPGHAIEGAWFILNEARERNNDGELTTLGLKMLNWMWKVGWDTRHGGIRYFTDALGKSLAEYWHDMKFWWPQNEAAVANWIAYELTGQELYLERFRQVDEYVHTYFLDEEQGEWFGYLHADNTLSSSLKGNMFKGPFHIPRMYLMCSLQTPSS